MIEEAEALLRRASALGSIGRYQPEAALARAELLARTGAAIEARAAYDVATGLERDAAVRRFLQQRQAALPA
jgi:predicted RNA polymerase sigma factor